MSTKEQRKLFTYSCLQTLITRRKKPLKLSDMKFVTLFAFFITWSGVRCISIICPPDVTIKPCTCQVSGSLVYTINIICTKVQSLDDLQLILPRMKGYKIDTFILEESNVTHLHSDTFQGLQIRAIRLSDMKLSAIADGVYRPPFMGLESTLEEIEINECFSDYNYPMPKLDLTHLKKLTKLKLQGNSIPQLGNDWFESGPYSLTELGIFSSNTKQLGSHAFSSLYNLKKFSYSGGFLNNVTRDMLPRPARYLNFLEFSNNNISSLPKDIFTGMPSLEEVYFEANYFKGIDEVVWAPVWNQLTHVYFFSNPLNCDEKMKWIYQYRLPDIFGGSCVKPLSLRGKALGSLSLDDFK